MQIKGIVTSKGLAMGTAYPLTKADFQIDGYPLLPYEEAMAVLNGALTRSKEQLRNLICSPRVKLGEKEKRILEAHIMMIEDPEYLETLKALLKPSDVNVLQAIEAARQLFENMFLSMTDDYMKERAADFNDISKRIMKCVLGIEETIEVPMNSIVICDDLEPSDTMALDPARIVGIITEKGGETSHSAIIAKGLGIPALSKIKLSDQPVAEGTPLIIDALRGILIIDPTEEDIDLFHTRKHHLNTETALFLSGKFESAKTIDGIQMEVSANIAGVTKIEEVLDCGADGVGLFRTEFLYMNRETPPTLEEQFQTYKEALIAFGSKPMVIRTFDIGGDKVIDYLKLEPEMNPFLGYRAVRISLDRTDLFEVQIRALLMASVYGNLKIMVPMISSIEEVIQVRAIVNRVQAELVAEGVDVGHYELGIMVEIPSVAVLADQFAKHVDFFSIGTNDLLQYAVAVDRMNEKLTHLYTWYHPGLLKMIQMVAEGAKKEGIWVGVCGEAAGDALLLPIFLSLGISELSMSARKIPEIKYRLRKLSMADAHRITASVFSLNTATDVKAQLTKDFNQLHQE